MFWTIIIYALLFQYIEWGFEVTLGAIESRKWFWLRLIPGFIYCWFAGAVVKFIISFFIQMWTFLRRQR